jgi:hypothetical protein
LLSSSGSIELASLKKAPPAAAKSGVNETADNEEGVDDNEDDDNWSMVSSNSAVSVGNDPNQLEKRFGAMKVCKPSSSFVIPPYVQKVNLPHTLLQIKDVAGQEYTRVEIHLLSGMTSDSIHPFVDQSGRHLYVKFFLPDVCADPW